MLGSSAGVAVFVFEVRAVFFSQDRVCVLSVLNKPAGNHQTVAEVSIGLL